MTLHLAEHLQLYLDEAWILESGGAGPQPCDRKRALTVGMKIAKLQFWIEMVAVTSAIACVLAFFLATLGAAAGVAYPSPDPGQTAPAYAAPPQSYEGIVTDTHCGAKHSAAVGMAAADCTRLCVHSGESFALVDGDKSYKLNGQMATLKRLAGVRVKVLGTLSGNTIAVASVSGAS